ncbi:MAG: electron transfer flavoprotein subunit alpha/FixB family protein [Candidatus Methanomethylophilaceae archaeon]|nr:electron transfer flavoprotein subunit alpha/FixB family protein [Candidatus Methanomethylophilaceae archaeon]
MSGCSGGSCSSCSSGDQDNPDRLPPGMLARYDINQSTADGVLVWVEVERDGDSVRMPDVCAEVLSAARSMCDGRVFAVVFGGPEVKALYPEMFSYGTDTVYHVRDARLGTYQPEAYADCMAGIVERVVPAVVLMGATTRGREVAPRLAAILQTGLTADCTSLSMDGRDLLMTRPAFGGNLMADIRCTRFPQMATVRPGAFDKVPTDRTTGTALYWQYQGEVPKEVLSEEPVTEGGSDIRDARILISLGNGIRDRSTVELAESVATRMGAMVSCSRSIVEKGWMPVSRQVGMSGRIVRPDLYIAMGISGSVQHRAGMSGARRIVAVNTDPDAPIHGFADLSLITDAAAVLAAMSRMLDGKEENE